jgi:hypothetical protein
VVVVEVICDNCGALKKEKANQEWILGYNWESRSQFTGAVRRLIRFLDRWYDRHALEPEAIHLCSPECKEQYADKNSVRVIITQRDLGIHSY